MSAATSPDYDFFLVHATEDVEVTKRLYYALERENKKVFASFVEAESKFGPGTVILHGIREAIYNSKMVLVILTKNSLESLWVLLEVILAWDKSIDAGKSCFKLLFYHLSPEEEADYRSNQFIRLPEFFFQKLPEKFEDLTPELIHKFSEQEEIEKEGYPGNISHGLAYSYYIGFLGKILDDLKKKIEELEDPAIDKTKMPKRFYVVLPKNGSSFKDYHVSGDGSKKLKKLNTAIIFPDVVCGVQRKKDAPVYCIEQGDKKFFLVGECPSVIRPLETLRDLDLKDLRVETPFQLARFIHTLEELLFFCDKPVFKIVEIVTFDGVDYDGLVENLISLAEKDLDMETYAVDCLNDLQPQEHSIPPAVPLSQEKHEEEVLVLFSKSSRDKEIFSKVTGNKQLGAGGIHWTWMELRQKQLSLRAKWVVVILTQAGLDDVILCQQMEICFTRCLEEKEINVICVTDVEYRDPKFPIIAKFCVGLDAKEDNDMMRLEDKVKTTDYPPLKHKMKAGDVATGLAWAFVTNYLKFNTDGLQKRMEEAYGEHHEVVLIPKLFILFPKSCCIPDKVQALKGEEKLKKPEANTDGGTRTYFVQCFKRTLKTKKKVIYAREFSTPSKTLHSMATKYEWAGLNEEGMQQQQKKLAEKVQEILEIEDVNEKIGDLNKWCEIIFYEDVDENLEEEIEERLQRCVDDLD